MSKSLLMITYGPLYYDCYNLYIYHPLPLKTAGDGEEWQRS